MRQSLVIIGAVLFLFLPVLPVSGQSNAGEVQIYIFSEKGLPLEEVTVEIDGNVFRSNNNGLLNFISVPGTHEFTLRFEGVPIARVSLPVRQGEVTEAIVTANPEAARQYSEAAATEDRRAIESGRRTVFAPDQPSGTIEGMVLTMEGSAPISMATVIFRGVDFETTTDAAGRFTAEVPAGEYSFSVIHPEFSTQTIDGVLVAVGERTEVTIELTPAAIELDEVMVFAAEEVIVQGGIANLIEETRNAGAVLNLIGAEQIGRTGDSDAAGALKRVTGLTVVDGRFVFVRGMGERYSSSLLNDARLPSPEPDRRVVPLDLLPTSVIESIAVQKAYSPSLPGDFGGGVISIRTAGIPDDRYQRRLRVDLSASLSYNQGTTFTDRLVESPERLDWLGIDIGTRKLPDEIAGEPVVAANYSSIIGDYENLTPEEVTELGKLLSDSWIPVGVTVPPAFGISGSVRDKVELQRDGSFGYNVSLLYSSSWEYQTGTLNSFDEVAGSPVARNEYTTEKTSHDIDIGSLVDLVYRRGRDLTIESTSLLVRTTDSVTGFVEGQYRDEGADDILQTEIAWTENTLFSESLSGRKTLGILNQSTLNGRYMFALANRYQPDSRYTLYYESLSGSVFDGEYDDSYGVASTRRDTDNQRVWTSVQDLVHDGSLSLEIPFFLGGGMPNFIDVGLYGLYQTRATDIRRFGYAVSGSDPLLQESPDILFADDNLGNLVDFSEVTQPEDNYTASHIIGAGYAETDLLIAGSVRVNAGARVEYSRQDVTTWDRTLLRDVTPILETVDFLPAINVTVPLLERSQVRVGASRTVNRPDLRELSLAPFFGPPGFGQLVGNPDLNRATIWNGDFRWETYLATNETVSLGVFYKYFQDPIEVVQLFGAGEVRAPINIPSALNLGVELEWAVQLRFISGAIRSLMLGVHFDSLRTEQMWRRSMGSLAGFFRNLRSTGNIAYIDSRVEYGEGVEYLGAAIANTSTTRPLQGQSPYVVNAALGYRNEISWSQSKPLHTSVFVNYNVVGPNIVTIGTAGVPDQYVQPFHQVDIVFRQQLGYIWSAGFEIGNVLDPPAKETIGADADGYIVQEYRKGRTVSVSVKASF